jgi:hypothetical protein
MKTSSMAFAMLSALASLFHCGETRADMVYTLVNDPVDQNGWTISGTITTDGTLGTVFGFNSVGAGVNAITAANVTISNGTTVLQSSIGFWAPKGASGSGLIATPTALEVAYMGEGGTYFYMDGGQFASDTIGWFNEGGTVVSAEVNINEFHRIYGTRVRRLVTARLDRPGLSPQLPFPNLPVSSC